MSLPIIKRFGRNLNRQKFMFLGFRRGKFFILKLRPLGNQSPPEHVVWRKKRWRYSQKCVLQSCTRNHKKIKINKKHLNMKFHPFVGWGGSCWADCFKFLCARWHPRRNHAYQILSRSRRGLRSYGDPKLGFSYSFSNRSYNSVTHYRAMLWLNYTLFL